MTTTVHAPDVRPYLELTRPGNAAMAALAASVGALAAHGWHPDPLGLLLGAACAALGVAGGNALNDALDWRIDERAHPERPVPRGAVSVPRAVAVAAGLLVAAVLAALATNAAALTLCLLMLGLLLAYEFHAKDRGLLGNVFVSLNTGALFLLGALAATTPTPASWPHTPPETLRTPAVMAGLAALLNLARELHKGSQDAPHDGPWRRTYAVRAGARASARLGTLVALASLPAALAPAALGWFPNAYVVALLPLALLVLAVPFVDASRTAQRLLKVAMIAGFLPFLATALI